MKASEFDAQIEDLETQMADLRDKMEDVCHVFQAATARFVATWFQERAERAITSNPEATKKQDVERLKKLKSSLAQMVDNAPELVQKHLDSDKYWAHRVGLAVAPYSHIYRVYGRSVPDELDGAVRGVLGYLGSLLAEYGFAEVGDYREWDVKYPDPHPLYRHAYDWSEDMKAVLNRYADLYQKLAILSERLKEVERQKSEAEAKTIWDQA
jgi:chaperonin cofactor prefoldin